jgi:predicted nucleotidyltransferase
MDRSDEWASEGDDLVLPLLGNVRLPDVAKKVIRRIIAGYRPQRVIVHGSFARGDSHEGSDLDLILIKRTEKRFIDRIEHVLAFSDGEMAVEPLVYTEKEIDLMLAEGNSFLEKALEEGIVVYEQ